MAVYSVEGKLGTGKTKFAVWMAQQALNEHRRVASNVDLRLELLNPHLKKLSYVRLPDKPKALDLEAAGPGNPDSYDEEKNGVMILDELGTWLNARSFQDKDRAPMLDWLIHARKHGWDVYLIVQDANMIDKQVREALIEYQVRLFRGDKIKIPVLGAILGLFNEKWGFLPKFHMATSRVGYGQNAVVAQRWMFKGYDLHAAYDTRQVFRPDYAHGSFCWIAPPGRIPEPLPWDNVRESFAPLVEWFKGTHARPKVPPKPKPAWVQLAMKLPPDQRIRVISEALRRHQRMDLAKRYDSVGVPTKFKDAALARVDGQDSGVQARA